jgi:excisionase family DNA binding protein
MRVLTTPLPGDDDPFMTVEEIAALTRLSRMTVYRAIRTGDLPATRFGRSFRVRESAFREWAGLPPAGETR